MPFLYTISVSLMNLTEATGGAWLPSSPQWLNYEKAWHDANFSLYFMNSVKITLITVIGTLIFCTLAAYAFARMEFPGKTFLFALLLSTLMLPEAVTWVPNFITVSWLGRIGPIPWINNWPALTIPFMAGAFGIFLLRQFFQQIPNELWDSAQIDGAGHLIYLFRVILPLSQAAVMTLALFTFIGSWNALAWPILVDDHAGLAAHLLRAARFSGRGRRAVSPADGRLGHHDRADPDHLFLHTAAVHRRHRHVGPERVGPARRGRGFNGSFIVVTIWPLLYGESTE